MSSSSTLSSSYLKIITNYHKLMLMSSNVCLSGKRSFLLSRFVIWKHSEVLEIPSENPFLLIFCPNFLLLGVLLFNKHNISRVWSAFNVVFGASSIESISTVFLDTYLRAFSLLISNVLRKIFWTGKLIGVYYSQFTRLKDLLSIVICRLSFRIRRIQL